MTHDAQAWAVLLLCVGLFVYHVWDGRRRRAAYKKWAADLDARMASYTTAGSDMPAAAGRSSTTEPTDTGRTDPRLQDQPPREPNDTGKRK